MITAANAENVAKAATLIAGAQRTAAFFWCLAALIDTR
jgi:hypothetical protein